MADQDIEIKIQAAIDASQAANSAKDLKASMRELNALANEVGETNTAAYAQIKEAAGQAALRVREMNESTRALAGTPLTATTKSFELLKENLLTLNFESLSKNITLFSSSLGKLNPDGLTEGFGKLGSSLLSLGKSLLTNPIFLIGAAIAFIILKFSELKEMGGIIGKVFSAIGDAIHAVIKFFTDLSDAIGLTDIAGKKKTENLIKQIDQEKVAIEDRYKQETEKARATHQSVTELEEQKLLATYNAEQRKIALLEERKKKDGELTEEEKKNLEEYKTESKKILGEIEQFYIKLYSDISEGQEKYVQKSKQLYVESITDPTKKAIEQAKLDREGKEKEESESFAKQRSDLELLIKHLTEVQSSYTGFLNTENTKQLKDAKEKLSELERLHKSNSETIGSIEKNADDAAYKAKADKDAQAEKDRLSKLKTADDKLITQNKETQDLITNNQSLADGQRLHDQIENINKRADLFKKELKDGVISKKDYELQIAKLAEDSEKLQSSYDEKLRVEKDNATKAELTGIVKTDQEKVKFAINDKERLEANIKLVQDQTNLRIFTEKLTGDKLIEINRETDLAILKLNADAELKDITNKRNSDLKIESDELALLDRKKGIHVGKELSIINEIEGNRRALIEANRKRELVGVEQNSEAAKKINEKYDAQDLQLTKDTQAKKTAEIKKAIDTAGGYAKEGMQVLQGLSDLADEADSNRLKKGEKASLETQKKQFARHKELSLVGAILSTAQGIAAAVAESPETGGLPGSAIAAAIGGLQIAKISSQKFQGDDSGDGGGSADAPSAPSFGVAQTLNTSSTQFGTGRFFGTGTAQPTNNTPAAPPIQVVVLEGDITKMQNKVQVTQSRASLGR